MDFKEKNVFVTGASGFIGGAVTHRLLREGANVVCLTKSSGWQNTIDLSGAEAVYEGDISDYTLMSDIISSHEIEYIFHFAANAIVRIAAKDPMNAYRSNVMGTVALLEAARNVGKCKKILVASSDKSYGDHEILPYDESMALQPNNTYDTSKACSDMIARTYAHNYSMPVVVTRCSNVYGPGDKNMSRIIPNSIRRILKDTEPLLYSDVRVLEREFIYIDDVVDACFDIIANGKDGEAYNIGGTGPIEVGVLIEKIKGLMGSDLATLIVDRDPTFKEIKCQWINAEKLKSLSGWSPKINLEEGLKRTIEWYKARQ